MATLPFIAIQYLADKQPRAEEHMSFDPEGCERLGKKVISGGAGAATGAATTYCGGDCNVAQVSGRIVSKATEAALPDGSPTIRRVGGTVKAILDDLP